MGQHDAGAREAPHKGTDVRSGESANPPSAGVRQGLREMPFEAQDALLRPGGSQVQGHFVEPAAAVRPTLRIGSSGHGVCTLQEQLNQSDDAGLAVDGIFAPKTRAAVTSFQSLRGLLVDGIVGPQTWAALTRGAGTKQAERPVTNVEDDDGAALDPSWQAFVAAVLRATAQALELSAADGIADAGKAAPKKTPPKPYVPSQLATWSTTVEANVMSADVALSSTLSMIASLSLILDDAWSDTPADVTRVQLNATSALALALSDPALLSLLGPSTREQPTLWAGRITGMADFYRSLLATGDPQAAPAEAQQAPISGRRQAMVGLALAQVGKVQAYREVLVAGESRRAGWQTLEMIFTAAKDYEPFSPRLFHTPWVDWCGPFATWAAANAGMPVDKWSGIASGGRSGVKELFSDKVDPSHKPMPGDIVQRASPTHYGIITWVDPAAAAKATKQGDYGRIPIRTVEGNTGNASDVSTHTGPLGTKWTAGFRDIERGR